MGAGWFEREHQAFGFAFPPVGERMEILTEQVEIVHRLWGADGGEVSFTGKHYRLDACPALPEPVQQPHPSLIIGGDAGPRSAALAARWADEYDVVYVDPAAAKDRVDRVSAACEAIGRDPSTLRRSLLTKTIVGTSEIEVRRRTESLMAWSNEDGDVDVYLDELRADHVVGTVDQVLERLAAFAAAGIQRVLLHQLVHEDLESVELIGREIIPAVAMLSRSR